MNTTSLLSTSRTGS